MTSLPTLIADIRREAIDGPDARSRFAMDALALCSLVERLGPPGRVEIFAQVSEERERQDRKWGKQDHPIRDEGTARYLRDAADAYRTTCDARAAAGCLTWFNIAIEEFFEAFAEDADPERREEFIQAIAVLVSIVEQGIDRKERV